MSDMSLKPYEFTAWCSLFNTVIGDFFFVKRDSKFGFCFFNLLIFLDSTEVLIFILDS